MNRKAPSFLRRFFGLQLPLFGTVRRASRPRARRAAKPLTDAGLHARWESLVRDFFDGRADLLAYTVRWSPRRQKRVLGCCDLKKCEVRVARELSEPECEQWLNPLLYHEMCHAALGQQLPCRGGKRRWHGPEFRSLVARHPQTAALERWISTGGWSHAVRVARGRETARRRTRSATE